MLKDLTLTGFNDVLASNAPAPGGGSVAALNGSLAASLIEMVCGLTVGRAKFADLQESASSLMAKAAALRGELLSLVDEDTEAYNQVSAAMALPKDDAEQKKARSQAMQAAFKTATLAPLKTLEKSVEALRLTYEAVGRTNPTAASDLGVSSLCLMAALRGAWLNVKINLGSIKDEAFLSEVKEKSAKLLSEGEKLANEIYHTVEQAI